MTPYHAGSLPPFQHLSGSAPQVLPRFNDRRALTELSTGNKDTQSRHFRGEAMTSRWVLFAKSLYLGDNSGCRYSTLGVRGRLHCQDWDSYSYQLQDLVASAASLRGQERKLYSAPKMSVSHTNILVAKGTLRVRQALE